jgi:hypothetical protein
MLDNFVSSVAVEIFSRLRFFIFYIRFHVENFQ